MKRSKHGLFVFPPKRTLIRRRHCSISQSCRSMTSKRFLESSSGMKFFQPSFRLTNQKRRAFVSVRQTNQIALFPFVCCFCFVRTISFQGHTKIALSLRENAWPRLTWNVWESGYGFLGGKHTHRKLPGIHQWWTHFPMTALTYSPIEITAVICLVNLRWAQHNSVDDSFYSHYYSSR